MTRAELQAKFPNASEAFLKANATEPDPLGRLVAPEREQDPRPTLEQDAQAQPRRRGSLAVVVTLIAFRRRLLDDDNNAAGFKHLRDSISRSLQIDDASSNIRFQCGQLHTSGAEGSLVRIEWL